MSDIKVPGKNLTVKMFSHKLFHVNLQKRTTFDWADGFLWIKGTVLYHNTKRSMYLQVNINQQQDRLIIFFFFFNETENMNRKYELIDTECLVTILVSDHADYIYINKRISKFMYPGWHTA